MVDLSKFPSICSTAFIVSVAVSQPTRAVSTEPVHVRASCWGDRLGFAVDFNNEEDMEEDE